MTTNKPTAIINYCTAGLVFLLAAGAFVLSYANLWETALAYGLSHRLAWIWPLLVDFALVVFSLAVVRASLHNERTWWPWLMVTVYTIATVTFNILHAPVNLTAQVVAVVAPVSLFLSFETLMSMLKSGVRRNSLVQSIAQITAKLGELEGLYQGQKDNLESELDSLERERLAEIEAQANQMSQQAEAKRVELANQIGQLESRLSQLQEEVEAKTNALKSYLQDIEAKKVELKGLTGGLTKTYLPANLTIEQKRELANRMAGDGLTGEQIATALGVSLATVKNYKSAAKIIRPEEVEGTVARNGNGKAGK